MVSFLSQVSIASCRSSIQTFPSVCRILRGSSQLQMHMTFTYVPFVSHNPNFRLSFTSLAPWLCADLPHRTGPGPWDGRSVPFGSLPSHHAPFQLGRCPSKTLLPSFRSACPSPEALEVRATHVNTRTQLMRIVHPSTPTSATSYVCRRGIQRNAYKILDGIRRPVRPSRWESRWWSVRWVRGGAKGDRSRRGLPRQSYEDLCGRWDQVRGRRGEGVERMNSMDMDVVKWL